MAGLEIDIDHLFQAELGSRFVHVRHPGDENLIHQSRRDEGAGAALAHLSGHGFLVYKFASEGGAVTSFVHAAIAPAFWARHTDFGLREHGGICYRLEMPAHGAARRLLVIFSSMSQVDQMYEAGFSARYFMRNLSQAPKYTPPDTAILRIADLGGVVGAFYTDTLAQPDNEARVSALIAKVMADLAVDPRYTVLYGTSKGASGALLHSLRTGLKAVCVEPILSDDYYVNRYRDSHFTRGLFPRDKRELFAAHLSADGPGAERVVVYSSRSPQLPYIREIAMDSPRGREMAFIDVQSPTIMDHPDVAPASLGLQVSLVNQMLCGVEVGAHQLDALRASNAA
ncbi:XcbB/CpsF family capsular polysaccharide biosynthesis protein [Pseudoxanthomonas daejeonensis]|uniref:Uncharacterized protein n=1 Tax=Pseudoxanthomonas daejeonensis TaxID=266062 RepID=A0ABQ6Z684_9GAMM|nr:XcbB/CpsF family capsular polysaccharide biosynthesis protein [Pseudoxanthomonas daejeonensis]KAF1694057.1 hypothetical protein CSC65_10375 [Pseudoxanthomonas daejeonensis]